MSRGTVTYKDRTAQTQNVEISKPKREGGRERERERERLSNKG